MKHKSRNTGKVTAPDFSRLIASMDNGQFLKNIDFSIREKHQRINPNTFAATENTLHWVRSFCTPEAEHKSQLGIDMTYKVGPFYTTCMSFPHPMFVYQQDILKHPTILAGMMTSTGRQTHDYMYMASQLKSRGISTLIYGTDGELALERGMEAIFPIEGIEPSKRSVKLRCFNHVKDDMLAQLKDTGSKTSNAIVSSILGEEYMGLRRSGLVDCQTHEFQENYDILTRSWPNTFTQYLESTKLRVRSLKDTFLKCMGRDTRVAAGLGNPPNKYSNQRAESTNTILKEAVGGHSVDQAAVHDIVYSNLVAPQERELAKAVYCQGEYRLAAPFRKLQVSPLRWKSMTEEQRQVHLKKVFKCHTQIYRTTPAITKRLSIQPQDVREALIKNYTRPLG